MGKMYVGVNNIPKNVNKIYVGVNGVARKVVKGYVGVNGIARVFWGGGAVENFWFYYKTANNDVLITQIQNQGGTELTWKKFNNSITFFALLHYEGYTYDYVLVLSTDPDGITCGRSSYISDTGTVTYNNETWYWGFCNNMVWHNSYYLDPIGCRLPDYATQQTMRTQGIQDVLAKIYANDFAEDYQVGQTYNLVKADMEKTIRKFIAIYLFFNEYQKANYSTAYTSILTHVEDIVEYFMTCAGNNDIINLGADYSRDGTGLAFFAYYSNDTLNNVEIEQYDPDYDGYGSVSGDRDVSYTSLAEIQFKGDGTISYSTQSRQYDDWLIIGKGGYGLDYMQWSNIGLSYQTVPHTIQPEYDYQTGQTYTVHTIRFNDLMESTKKLFFDYAENIGGMLTRASVIYLRNYWGEIKTAILSTITGIGQNFTSITFTISYNRSSANCSIVVLLGSSSFPQQVGIDSKSQDPAGTDYWYLNTTRPSYTHTFTTTIYSDHYYINPVVQRSGYHEHIGIYVQTAGSSYNYNYAVEGSNYGMKRT